MDGMLNLLGWLAESASRRASGLPNWRTGTYYSAVREVVARKIGLVRKRDDWRALAGDSDTMMNSLSKFFDILLLNHCICRHFETNWQQMFGIESCFS